MRINAWCLAVIVGAFLFASQSALAQQGGFGGGMGGGGFGGGGLGGGGMGGGLGGGALNQNQSMLNQLNQSIGTLPSIMGRQAQGLFGTRTIGSASRQRYRMLMGRSQAGGGMGSQYASSGAFSQSRRGTLPGSGMLTTSSLIGSNTSMQQRGGAQQTGQQPNQRPNQPSGQNLAGKRLTIRVGFEPQKVSSQRLTAGLRQRYARVPGLDSAAATLVGRTVVLRGSAATDHARDLAEQLARLEPGIDVVQNELATPQVLPAPRRPSSRPSMRPPAAKQPSILPPPAGQPSTTRQSPAGPALEPPPSPPPSS